MVVAERDFVLDVRVVLAFQHPRLARRLLRDVVEWTGVVPELRREERAEGVQVRREHASGGARRRHAAGVRLERRQRTGVVLLLEAAEREELVLDDRSA